MYSRMNITDNKIIMMGRNDAGKHSTGGHTVGSNKEMLRKSFNVGLCLPSPNSTIQLLFLKILSVYMCCVLFVIYESIFEGLFTNLLGIT